MSWNSNRYDKMQYRSCGKWGLKLPVISLGAWQTVGGYEEEEAAKKVFYAAFEAGITHFDFANNYGSPAGSAEVLGGKILRELPLDEIVIASKAGHRMWPGPYGDWGSRKYIIASCDQSLKRMGIDYFDIFYHHRPDPNTPLEETHGALETLIQQGKVLYAGVSGFYSPERSAETVQLRERKNWSPLTVQMNNYSLFNRKLEEGLKDTAAEHGIGLLAYCPLAQGLLTNKYLNGIPTDSRAGKNKLKPPTEDELRKIRLLDEVAAARGQSLAQMAMAWILRLKEMTSVVTAVSSLKQLEDSLKLLDNMEFSEDELRRIDSILQ
ncbi:aldo/keto reductase [Paenibacillus cremeus]|uniref:L-glyceraldehyde 3-phosphate reductase n=1 Tax=Paenibacillus cremeus TaxID=2163881 RepID=A0A559JZY1_9BACL|nr:aldo/keto reductase [Paenibacillus cremeus]TVY05444.1 L-glyceraldehyde 3-phosphate reductase [Paenibacillus cremeus]